MESFKKLGLSEEIIKALAEAKFENPTEIQEKAIPLSLQGKDIIGSAATGSGKTLAFGSQIIQNLQRKQGVQALIMTPTRELAEQVGKNLRAFSKHHPLNIVMVYGGVSIGPQVSAIEHADVIVGTPGRILDHLTQGTLSLRKIKILVLDEADRMLDMGFIEDVDKIISQCPKERQTMLFSATISPDIEHLTKKYLKNPVNISVETYVDPSLLKQVYYDVPKEQKFSLLVHLLKKEEAGLVMVFCNTRRNTDIVARNLNENEIDAMPIHGGLSQQKRNSILERFHGGKVCVLVCTDVAARGLDIKGVSHVYNYDSPPNSKEYVHRIGRTARAGKEGIAISLVSQRDYENFRNVLRNSDLKIEPLSLPENMQRVFFQVNDHRDRGRRSFSPRGHRESGGRESRGRSYRGREDSRGERRNFGGRGRGFGERSRSYGGRGRRY
ncbi:DEAD/DEAH box helicase [Candidatus Pacearchaeota archaeon]|nr:DEAD/DEAH box helicase [Candidatus Pacearchaeota archaeon]